LFAGTATTACEAAMKGLLMLLAFVWSLIVPDGVSPSDQSIFCQLNSTPVTMSDGTETNLITLDMVTSDFQPYLLQPNSQLWFIEQATLPDGTTIDNGTAGSSGGTAWSTVVDASGTLVDFPIAYENEPSFTDVVYVLDGPPDVGNYLTVCFLFL
jgi:hypothetical protein